MALFNAMMQVIVEEGLQDRDFIAQRTEGFAELSEVVMKYRPEEAAWICGIDVEDLEGEPRSAQLTGLRSSIPWA